MTFPTLQSSGKYFGLTLLSGSILALQISFTRIFSLMIWHHFTYMVIGIALLGGGAAGTFLAVRRWGPDKLQQQLGWLALLFSLTSLSNLLAISTIAIDPLRAAQIVWAIIGLGIYFICLFSTFFTGGLVIAAIFGRWAGAAHRLYFADMLGAGLATVTVLLVIEALGGPAVIGLVGLIGVVAAALLGYKAKPRWLLPAIMVVEGLLLIALIVRPPTLAVPGSKELGWAIQAQQATPEFTRWDAVGRVDVMPEIIVTEPMIVGAVSSSYPQEGRPELPLKLVTIDGTSMTGMYQFDGSERDLERFRFLDHAIISAVYQLGVERPHALLIGVGGGLDILLARRYDAERITAIELNPTIVELLKGRYADYTGRIAYHPSTELIVAEGRSFLSRATERYDVIQGIGLDNLAALSGGAYVLAESYLYTVDAFEQALHALTPNGVISWTRDVNSPPREMLRLTGLAAEALRRMGVSDPARHIVVIANESGRNATLLVSRSPFRAEQIEQLRAWGESHNFTMLHDPFSRLDTVFAEYLHAADPRAFEQAYTFQIFPVTDDNPFFYNYFRWESLHFDRNYEGRLNRFPIGNLILITMAVFALGAAITFIIWPLARYQRDGLRIPGAAPALAYFSLLGAAYMFIQIVLIQRFTLFIGYPIHATTTTIASMLAFAAVGSLLFSKYVRSASRLRLVGLGIAGLTTLYIFALPVLFDMWLQWPDPVRIVVSAALIAPLAIMLGIPFPAGLRQLSSRAPELVVWAWGMNGVFSVLGSVLVIVVSMASNFTTAMFVGAAGYAAAAIAGGTLWRVAVEGKQALSAPAEAKALVKTP
ncbi:hypothetical protein [Chloroflexus sp.]|uniref:hypothetical protein n=1 Tax=Chloroflexus sp. TaxID=1904827 RepID=UPI00262197C1|nr:hypothetical protein [uncultured Chloroflexus sp.]